MLLPDPEAESSNDDQAFAIERVGDDAGAPRPTAVPFLSSELELLWGDAPIAGYIRPLRLA